jgi:uncharacterized protein (TIGR02145 family)
MKIKYLAFLLISAGTLFLTDCKKDKEPKPDDKEPVVETIFSGLEFTDEETQSTIPEISLPLYGGVYLSSFELKLPPPEDQKKKGTCLTFAVAYGVMGYYIGGFESVFGGVNKNRVGSPEFLHNLTKPNSCDEGTYIVDFNGKRGVLDILKEDGVCTWNKMPYTKECSIQPNIEQYADAKNYKILKYERLTEISENLLKSTLLNDHPIIIGCSIGDDFGSKYGVKNPPIWKEKGASNKIIGHAMILMGYDDDKKAFKIQNSGGTNWGDQGYVWMDYAAASSLINSAYIVYPDITRPNSTAPTLKTTVASNITKNSAKSGGNITYDGGASVTAKGVVWHTAQNPTLAHKSTNEGSGSGSFVSNINGLKANTKYYVRAYATNSKDTAYGNQIEFSTQSEATITKATVQTTTATTITKTTAKSGGNVTNDGGASVTERGVCWNTATNPTTSNSKKVSTTNGTGAFAIDITGLKANTIYYAKAYATNSEGTAYGNEITFTTQSETNTAPTIQTVSASDITPTTAVSGGNVTSDGGANVTARGVCWNTSPNPSTSNSKTNNGGGTGSFTANLSGLKANTTYYVRAYATNSVNTAYGNQISFKTADASASNPYLNPNLTYGTVTDIEGNKYATIKIGFQTWMAENLKVTKYNDGTNIPFVLNITDWTSLSTGAYTIYDFSPENEPIYGKLYNQYAVFTEKLCPKGWHIPSDEQWEQLRTYLLSQSNSPGGKLKSTGTVLWLSPNTEATNESGFSGLPGGMRNPYSYQTSFEDLKKYGEWWSLTSGIYYYLSYNSSSFNRDSYESSNSGMSCRCVKD